MLLLLSNGDVCQHLSIWPRRALKRSALDLFLRCYSSWPHLQTLMTWLLRFVEYLKKKRDRHHRDTRLDTENCPVGSTPALP